MKYVEIILVNRIARYVRFGHPPVYFLGPDYDMRPLYAENIHLLAKNRRTHYHAKN